MWRKYLVFRWFQRFVYIHPENWGRWTQFDEHCSMFFKWVGSTTNYRYSKGPWKWTCQHDHIFEGSLAFPYHAAMGIDSLNFQGSFGTGDWCWFLMKKTGSVVKYLISELGSYIYIYIHITYDEYISIWIYSTQIYVNWDYVLCLWLYS